MLDLGSLCGGTTMWGLVGGQMPGFEGLGGGAQFWEVLGGRTPIWVVSGLESPNLGLFWRPVVCGAPNWADVGWETPIFIVFLV